MNVTKFVVLGALESIKEGSDYDIITELENKKISNWTEVKKGSIYHALKTLQAEEAIIEVSKMKTGLYPEKTIFKITNRGKSLFDKYQTEAFLGLYPKFYGFKLALKFNSRRSPEEIKQFGEKAINAIDEKLNLMDMYLNSPALPKSVKESDGFFIEHERMLFKAEREWINMARRRLGK
jgi:DNA-binding PadR family transcriptional regulator